MCGAAARAVRAHAVRSRAASLRGGVTLCRTVQHRSQQQLAAAAQAVAKGKGAAGSGKGAQQAGRHDGAALEGAQVVPGRIRRAHRQLLLRAMH